MHLCVVGCSSAAAVQPSEAELHAAYKLIANMEAMGLIVLQNLLLLVMSNRWKNTEQSIAEAAWAINEEEESDPDHINNDYEDESNYDECSEGDNDSYDCASDEKQGKKGNYSMYLTFCLYYSGYHHSFNLSCLFFVLC